MKQNYILSKINSSIRKEYKTILEWFYSVGTALELVQLRKVKRKFKTVSERRRPEGNFSCVLCRKNFLPLKGRCSVETALE